jgi:hypothetical protein
MTDENKSEPRRQIKWVKSPEGVFETYSNQTHISWSLDDVSLRFAQLGQIDVTPGLPVESVNFEKATVTISWRIAKILHLQLTQLINNYEKVNGEIKIKPELASSEGT